MNTLYESDAFSVVHLQHDVALELEKNQANAGAGVRGQSLIRHGFEIVDKRTGREVYLDGGWAEVFHAQIQEWQENMPTQEEVEDMLDSYSGLAQNPVIVH